MRIARSHGLVLAAFTALTVACGDDKSGGEPKPDAAVPDAEVEDAGVPDREQDAEPACTEIPEHSEIINAATDTEKADKQPVLPLLRSDGTLPPLP